MLLKMPPVNFCWMFCHTYKDIQNAWNRCKNRQMVRKHHTCTQWGQFSNRVALNIGSLSILLLGISLCGCDSNPVTGPVDSGDARGGLDEQVSEAEISESDMDSTAEQSVASGATHEETAMSNTDGKLLRHAVFFSFKEDSTEENIAGVTAAFAALPSKIDSRFTIFR